MAAARQSREEHYEDESRTDLDDLVDQQLRGAAATDRDAD
jgi:hypothetical protein